MIYSLARISSQQTAIAHVVQYLVILSLWMSLICIVPNRIMPMPHVTGQDLVVKSKAYVADESLSSGRKPGFVNTLRSENLDHSRPR